MEERFKLLWSALFVDMLLLAAILIFAILAVNGCSQVQMSPAYKQELIMTNILVRSLNADCQAGDPNACREGLAESAKVLQLLVDAVAGVDPDGGQVR